MIDCKHAARLISRAMDDRLPFWDHVRLRLHLAVCDACTNARRQMQLLRRAMRRLMDDGG
jgi:hypothetical protein